MSHLSCDSVLKYPASSLRIACKQNTAPGARTLTPYLYDYWLISSQLPYQLGLRRQILVLSSSSFQQTLHHSAITIVINQWKLLFHTHSFCDGRSSPYESLPMLSMAHRQLILIKLRKFKYLTFLRRLAPFIRKLRHKPSVLQS